MIPADPSKLEQGEVVFIRYAKNPGNGQEPAYHFREAKVHEAKPKVVFIKYKDEKYRLTQKVRPCMVFLEAERKRVSTVPAPVTVKEAAQDTDFSTVKEKEIEAPPPPPDPEDLFGEPMARKATRAKSIKAVESVAKAKAEAKPPTFNVNDFRAWLEMGKSFAYVPKRLRQLREEGKEIESQLNALQKRFNALHEEEKILAAQHKEMKALLGDNVELLR